MEFPECCLVPQTQVRVRAPAPAAGCQRKLGSRSRGFEECCGSAADVKPQVAAAQAEESSAASDAANLVRMALFQLASLGGTGSL